MGRKTGNRPTNPQSETPQEQLAELYQRPAHLARRINQRATELFAEWCPEITPRQYGALVILSKIEGLDQKRLAELLFVDQTNIGVIVRGLEKRGFIRRACSASDRRQKIIQMTESGRLSFQTVQKKVKNLDKTLLSGLEPDEVATLTELMTKVVRGKSC